MGSEVKRKRGGQPGNQNGRVHGLYSKSLTPQEQQYLQSVLSIPGIDLDVALLCTKFAAILAKDPDNHESLYNVTSSLDRLLGHDRQKLVDTLKNTLRVAGLVGILPQSDNQPHYPEPVESGSLRLRKTNQA